MFELIKKTKPKEIHKKIAGLPISNFVDLTLDRCLLKAILEIGKKPILHDFKSQSLGTWQQSNPSNPNVFFSFGNLLDPTNPLVGLHEQILIHPQNRIQIENMMEMVSEKDLLLLDFSSYEAEFILHLSYLASSSEKIINTRDLNNDLRYWCKRGVIILDVKVNDLIQYLLPYTGNEYSFLDKFIPGRMMIDITREKEYDCFMSYFSGDKGFAKKLESDLSLRGLRIWRDDNEIEIGDSFSDKIQEGLKNSYSFIIILSKEALGRAWVKEEMKAAYSLRLAEEFKILPVLYRDCEIPLFLSDYKYADFREEKRYSEQIALLEKSIRNAVKRARKKK